MLNRFKPSAAGKGDQRRPYDKAKFDSEWDKFVAKRKAHCKDTDSCEYPDCKCGYGESLYEKKES